MPDMNMGTASYLYDIDSVPKTEKHLSYDEFFARHPEQRITVAELIALLQQYPPDMVVCTMEYEYNSPSLARGVSRGLLEYNQGLYRGDGLNRYLVGREYHTCDVVIID